MYRSLVSLGRYIPKYFILFVAMENGIVSLISFSTFSLFVYIMQGISVCWFYILQLYYIHWLVLVIFWWSLCRGSCHLQTVRVLLLLFQFEFLLFLFLLWLLWPKLPKLCWIAVLEVGTLVLFLTLGEIVGRFFTVWATRAEKLCPEKFRQHHGQGTKWPGGDVRDQHSLWSKKSKDFKN